MPLDVPVEHGICRGVQADGSGLFMSKHRLSAVSFGQSKAAPLISQQKDVPPVLPLLPPLPPAPLLPLAPLLPPVPLLPPLPPVLLLLPLPLGLLLPLLLGWFPPPSPPPPLLHPAAALQASAASPVPIASLIVHTVILVLPSASVLQQYGPTAGWVGFSLPGCSAMARRPASAVESVYTGNACESRGLASESPRLPAMTVFANDPDLLVRFRAGERDALARVYWFYVARIEAMIRRGLLLARGAAVSAPGLRADTADLVQEAFVRAFSESSRLAYDGVREYRPLLTAIARNALTDHLRRLGREIDTDAVALESLMKDTSSEPVEEPADDLQTVAMVERYVAALAPPEHAVYLQRYVHGRSQRDSADALGISRQQLRTLENHIRAGLARELARARLRPAAVIPAARPKSSPPELGDLRIKSEGDG
jgi:RNA polymerase sigma factor (sigma-70 family)